MKRRLSQLFLLMATASLAHAHFVFVVPEPGGASAKVFISETLQPDPALGVEMVSDAKLSVRSGDGRETPLVLVKDGNAYVVALSGQGTRVVHGLADLGLFESGPTKAYLLLYHPKTILGNAFEDKVTVGRQTPVELVPVGEAGAVALQLVAHGKPQTNAEITVILPDGTQRMVKTDAKGQTENFGQIGRYGAWARYWEAGSGEREGKKYDELRHYATLVFDAPAPSSVAEAGRPAITAKLFAKLPQAASSFGSAVSDGWLYIYGGHVVRVHSYSTEAVSGQFHRLKLTGKPVWEDLPGGPGLQGMNLAAHGGKIYRIGGMAPRNAPGAAADNYSVAECARFDPATKKWEALPSLPEPRSSHDVVVIGDTLIVTGGWAIRGGRNEWMETLAVLDLKSQPLEWKTLKQPFQRRALMAAAYDGKMYVIGGFDEKNQIVRDVSIYDPKSNGWSDGPKIPPGPGLPFAPAAGVHDGDLYVSVSDGTLYRLSKSGQDWERVGSTTPRLAHRIASLPNAVLVIGGADKGDNSDLIEAIPARREVRR